MISLSIDAGQMERLKGALNSVQSRTVPTVLRSARKALWKFTVDDVKRAIAERSGIGRRIWGNDPSGLDKQGLVSQGRLLITQDGGQTSLVLRGIPALLEGGGPIKPHLIRRPFGNKGPGGKPLSKPRPKMQHPGMKLRAHRFGLGELRGDEPEIQTFVNDAVGEMLRRAGF